ncbi:hypothetical protein [Dickeya fangzhongdai]|uniref:hypothetical protein n=1 Tax=Dickeya fangzhongdai TaxID=1778540 RepID=UPI0026E09E55|nr:hypothetical protein [Dickeya fangzhongdai]WKV51062.1 hypothetical protein PL145_01965 [Dickeya fangzhongdai]
MDTSSISDLNELIHIVFSAGLVICSDLALLVASRVRDFNLVMTSYSGDVFWVISLLLISQAGSYPIHYWHLKKLEGFIMKIQFTKKTVLASALVASGSAIS